jgi:hypothetical protein
MAKKEGDGQIHDRRMDAFEGSSLLDAARFGNDKLVDTTFGNFASQVSELVYQEFEDYAVVQQVLALPEVSPVGRTGESLCWGDTVLARDAIESVMLEIHADQIRAFESEATVRAESYLEELLQKIDSSATTSVSLEDLQEWMNQSPFVTEDGLTPRDVCAVLCSLAWGIRRQELEDYIDLDNGKVDSYGEEVLISKEELVDLPGAYAETVTSPLRIELNEQSINFMERVTRLMWVTPELRRKLKGKLRFEEPEIE